MTGEHDLVVFHLPQQLLSVSNLEFCENCTHRMEELHSLDRPDE